MSVSFRIPHFIWLVVAFILAGLWGSFDQDSTFEIPTLEAYQIQGHKDHVKLPTSPGTLLRVDYSFSKVSDDLIDRILTKVHSDQLHFLCLPGVVSNPPQRSLVIWRDRLKDLLYPFHFFF